MVSSDLDKKDQSMMRQLILHPDIASPCASRTHSLPSITVRAKTPIAKPYPPRGPGSAH